MAINKTFLLITLTVSAISLTGCKEEAKTQQWYKAHPDEMNRVWKECKESGDDTQNCRNAIDAHFQVQQANAPIPDLNDLSDVHEDLFKKDNKGK